MWITHAIRQTKPPLFSNIVTHLIIILLCTVCAGFPAFLDAINREKKIFSWTKGRFQPSITIQGAADCWLLLLSTCFFPPHEICHLLLLISSGWFQGKSFTIKRGHNRHCATWVFYTATCCDPCNCWTPLSYLYNVSGHGKCPPTHGTLVVSQNYTLHWGTSPQDSALITNFNFATGNQKQAPTSLGQQGGRVQANNAC